MSTIASEITNLAIVYSIVYSDADQSKHQSSVSLAFVWEFTRTGEFPAQMASYVENVSIWWLHHGQVDFIEMMLHKLQHIEVETRWMTLADDIYKCIFFNENVNKLIQISLRFFPGCPINN